MQHFMTLRRLLATGLATFCLAEQVGAQTLPAGLPNITPDEFNVNMVGGQFNLDLASVSIGDPQNGGLKFGRTWTPTNPPSNQVFIDNVFPFLADASYSTFTNGVSTGGANRNAVSYGKFSKNFILVPVNQTVAGTTNFADPPDGSMLFFDSTFNATATSKDGSVIQIPREQYFNYSSMNIRYSSTASTYIKPNGEKLKYIYSRVYDAAGLLAGKRIQSILSNFGYMLHFDYALATVTQPLPANQIVSVDWFALTKVTAINSAVDYCDPSAIICPAFARMWPSLAFTGGRTTDVGGTVTDDRGVISAYASGTDVNGAYYTVTRNGVLQYLLRLGLAWTDIYPAPAVTSVTRNGATWSYSFPNTRVSILSMARTDPSAKTRIVTGDVPHGNVLTYTDEQGRVTTNIYDSRFLLQYTVEPEGTLSGSTPTAGYTKYDYDQRGNLLQTTKVPKAGSPLANVVTSAGYDASCANIKTCNQPNWTKDALGNQTDYAYSTVHGGLTSRLSPAPSAGAPRALMLITYGQHYAWIKNAAGALVQMPDAVWRVESATNCQTVAGAGNSTPACDTGATQTVTTYQYGSASAGESMLVKGKTISAAGATLRTCYSYDAFHRRISETSPKANLGVCP